MSRQHKENGKVKKEIQNFLCKTSLDGHPPLNRVKQPLYKSDWLNAVRLEGRPEQLT